MDVALMYSMLTWNKYLLIGKLTKICLTIPTGENCCFTQFSIRVVAWLLLNFFVCLQNQLSSILSTVRY